MPDPVRGVGLRVWPGIIAIVMRIENQQLMFNFNLELWVKTNQIHMKTNGTMWQVLLVLDGLSGQRIEQPTSWGWRSAKTGWFVLKKFETLRGNFSSRRENEGSWWKSHGKTDLAPHCELELPTGVWPKCVFVRLPDIRCQIHPWQRLVWREHSSSCSSNRAISQGKEANGGNAT